MLATILSLPALIYAAYWDQKERIIPNKASGVLFWIGVMSWMFPVHFSSSAGDQIAGLLVSGAGFLILAICAGGGIGGGDYKLYTALGFAVGLKLWLTILFVSHILMFLYCVFTDAKGVPAAVFLLWGILVSFSAPFLYVLLQAS